VANEDENESPEARAIEAAYGDQVELLFKVLITNLADRKVSKQTEQQCVDKFTAGLGTAKRARRLTLGAL
jgi:hypothetical protein